MTNRDDKLREILRDLGAKFLMQNGNGTSLLTVTNVELSNRGKNANILFTVFPDQYEKTALEFAKRKRGEFRAFVKENSKLGRIPLLDFDIDKGEKNRQKIDSLLNE